jgi:Ca-activated chloride channel family protein
VRFEWPFALLGLVALPAAVAAYLYLLRRRARFALRYTNVDVVLSVARGAPPRRRRIAPALFLLAAAAAVFAVARPQVSRAVLLHQSTVVLTIDTSGSMVANDIRPTRLGAAEQAVRTFVRHLPGPVRVAMVAFSTEPHVVLPVTNDHDLALESLEHLTAFGGTAIGDAIGRSVDLIRPRGAAAVAPPVVSPLDVEEGVPLSAIVLLTDGAQNSGKLQPLAAAERARKWRIPVYTVALGTPGGTLRVATESSTEVLHVPPDPTALRQIASITGGEFFAAASGARLNEIYNQLASRLTVKHEYREATFAFVAASAALLLASGLAGAFWSPRLP